MKNHSTNLTSRNTGWTGSELLAQEFPVPVWLVGTVLPADGLILLAGKPKAGKSWLSLQLALALAGGEPMLGGTVERRRVLYLALEDTGRRLKDRLVKLRADPTTAAGIHFKTAWADDDGKPLAGIDAVDRLDKWLTDNPAVKVAIIDTVGRFVGASGATTANQYATDYDLMAKLQAVANTHGATVLAITHTRKLGADDVFDTVSGSVGVFAAADTTAVLSRTRGEDTGKLFVTGRDVDEAAHSLRFDKATCRWERTGAATFDHDAEQPRATKGAGVEQFVLGWVNRAALPQPVKALEAAVLAAGFGTGGTYKRARKALEDAGKLVTRKDGHGTGWWVAPAARADGSKTVFVFVSERDLAELRAPSA